MHILVVDHDLTDVQLMRSLLSAVGKVTAVPTPEEALSFCKQTIPHCVLLETRLPGMTGVRLLHELRQNPRMQYVPLLVLTKFASIDSAVESVKAGAFDLLTKDSITQASLSKVILKAREAKRLEQYVDAQQQRVVQENYELKRRHRYFANDWAEMLSTAAEHINQIQDHVGLVLDRTRGDINDSQGKCLALARGGCTEVQHELERLQLLTQLDQMVGKLRWRATRLDQVIERSANDVLAGLMLKRLTLDFVGFRSCTVYTDEFLLAQIVNIVLQKAVQLARPDSAIRLRMGNEGGAGVSVEIDVPCDVDFVGDADVEELDWRLSDRLTEANASAIKLVRDSHVGVGIRFALVELEVSGAADAA